MALVTSETARPACARSMQHAKDSSNVQKEPGDRLKKLVFTQGQNELDERGVQ
jgi:hypothetical protein